MEARASDAEKKVQELNAKLERVSPQLQFFMWFLFAKALHGYLLLERFHLLNILKHFCESVVLSLTD
jgi:hypothetical protein